MKGKFRRAADRGENCPRWKTLDEIYHGTSFLPNGRAPGRALALWPPDY